MAEDEVYVGTKKLLARNGWLLLGGQPPKGSNHLPVIEVKWPDRASKGSKGAFKPDLIAFKDNILLLVECKPKMDMGDIEKLREILSDQSRKDEIFIELEKRNIMKKIEFDADCKKKKIQIMGGVAFSEIAEPLPDLWTIIISDSKGLGTLTEPSLLSL